MPIFKTKTTGYRNVECLLSIAAIFPPEKKYRTLPDGKKDEDATFHLTVVNDKDLDTERSAYIPLSKNQLKKLHTLIGDYLITGTTKELP